MTAFMGSRPIGCVCNLPMKKEKRKKDCILDQSNEMSFYSLISCSSPLNIFRGFQHKNSDRS